MHRLDTQAGNQRHHVVGVYRNAVVIGEEQAIAAPAPDDVRADDPVIAGQRIRQHVEIATVAGQPMHADQDPWIRRIAPLDVSHPVQAMRAQTAHRALAHLVQLPPGRLTGPRCHHQFFESLQYRHDRAPLSFIDSECGRTLDLPEPRSERPQIGLQAGATTAPLPGPESQ